MDEQLAIVGRLFTRAAARSGSGYRLAQNLGITFEQLERYMAGEAMPPDPLLILAVDLIMDEVPVISSEFSDSAQRALADRLISARRRLSR